MSKIKKAITKKPIQNPIAKVVTLGVSSGLGLGYVPGAPGTAGSVLGVAAGLYLLQLHHLVAWGICAAMLVVFSLLGARAGKHWGDMDSGHIVSDEVLGQSITLLGCRFVAPMHTWGEWQVPSTEVIVASFVLFRLLDIMKPFPARTFDRLSGGFHTQADDVVAGFYGALIVWAGCKIVYLPGM